VSERSAAVVQDYVFVPAVSVDAERLLAFDAAAQPERQARDRILASWWTRATPECAVAAITLRAVCYGWDLRRPAKHLDLPVRPNSSNRDLFMVR
jgi:hypothetical protein